MKWGEEFSSKVTNFLPFDKKGLQNAISRFRVGNKQAIEEFVMKMDLRTNGDKKGDFLPHAVRKDSGLEGSHSVTPAIDKERNSPVQTIPVYSLSDMLKQCDFDAPPSADMAEWDSAPPVGGEDW